MGKIRDRKKALTKKFEGKDPLQVNKIITAGFVKEHNNKNRTPGENKRLTNLLGRHEQVFNFISPYLKKEFMLLDHGGRDGLFLNRLKKAGFKNLFAIDISEAAINTLNSRGGMTGFVGDIESMSMFEDNKFDFVNSSHVLEHCSNPAIALKEIFRVLKPEGLLMLEVPMQSGISPRAGHFSYFPNTQSVKKILKECNFSTIKEVVEARKSGQRWVRTINKKELV